MFSCVGNDRDLREVFEAAATTMRKGAIFVDHTTASARSRASWRRRRKSAGLGFLDAPVSGGQAGAEAGKLTVMAGGEPSVFAEAQPIMAAYAANMTLIGPAGSGQLAKMVNQICIAGVLQGLAEGLHFAKRAELDVEKVIAAISKGAAQSWQMENRWKTMSEGRFDFGFAVDWMRKDLGLVLDEAERNGAKLELTELIDALLRRRAGDGRQTLGYVEPHRALGRPAAFNASSNSGVASGAGASARRNRSGQPSTKGASGTS